MKVWFLQFLLLLFFCVGYSQNLSLIDSLNQKILETDSDSLKSLLFKRVATEYIFTNTIGAREPALHALRISEKINNASGIMDASNLLGIMHYRLSAFDSSLFYYRKALVLAEQKDDTARLIKYKGNIALSLSSQSRYEEALKMYVDLIEIKEIYNPAGVALILLDIASIYYHLKDYNQALNNAREAKLIAEKFNEKRAIANACNSIGVFLEELGKIEEALTYYKQSLQLKIEMDDKLAQLNTLINIANVYYKDKQYYKSIEINDSVILLGAEIGATRQQADGYTNNGNIYSELKLYQKANSNFKKAYRLYTETGSLELMVELAGSLGENYLLMNDYSNAAAAYREQSVFKDSLYNRNMTADLAEMRTKFETEKKEQENLRLSKENELKELKLAVEKQNKQNLIWFFAITLVLIVGLFLLILNRIRLKKKVEMERQLAEQKRIGFEAVIEAEEKERIRIAKDLHDGIGQQISAVNIQFEKLAAKLEDKAQELEPDIAKMKRMITGTGDEVRSISHKMMPRALTEFGLIDALEDMLDKSFALGKVAYHFDHHNMENRLPQNIEIALYRITQELINNIIKHANADKVEVQLVRKINHCILIVQDNGKGIETTGKEGIGIHNINSRLQLINGELNLESDTQSGTTAIIRIDLSKPYGNATT